MTTAPTVDVRYERVPLASIKAHPDNPRVDVGDVTDLAASILSVGLLEPLVVAPRHDGVTARQMGKATHLLIAGHRRLAAAKKAKLLDVPVLVRDDLTTRASQIEAMLVENLQRTDLTPVEEADAYQLVMDLDGLTQKALAAKVGQPVTRIRDRLKLAKIGEAGRAALQAHQVTIEQALAIAEFDDDPKTQKAIVKAVGTDSFRFEVNRATAERARARELQERLDRLAAAGVTVLDDKPKGARELTDLLPEFPQRYQATEKQADAAEKKLHKDCPGRVTYWATEYGSKRLYHGCTQPKLHPKRAPEKSPAERAREAKLARLKEDLAVSAGAAAAARAAFIRDRIAQPADPVLVRTRLQDLVLARFDLDDTYAPSLEDAWLFLDVLGEPVPEVEKGTDKTRQAADLAEALTETLQNLGVNALVLALDLATHLTGEDKLRSTSEPYPHDYTYERARTWVEALTTYGYGWSDWERARFWGFAGHGDQRVQWTVAGVVDDSPDPSDKTVDEDAGADRQRAGDE